MEQEYSIGTTNKFFALIDSDDAFDFKIDPDRQKKKQLKTQTSNENKENKVKDNDARAKPPQRKPTKPADRVLTAERNIKADNQERVNTSANRSDRPPRERNQEGRPNNFRDGAKLDGTTPRGPRPDGQRGERRDGPRPPRVEGEGRPNRGPRPDGESRPYRGDRDRGDRDRGDRDRGDRERGDRPQAGSDSERPQRRERREYSENPDADGRTDRRPPGRGRGPRPPGRNYDNRGKREFDRRSGSDRTGVKAVDKRDGAGSYNWDSNKDPEALVADLNVTSQSDEITDWDETPKEIEPPKEGEAVEEPPAAPVEEEPKELTLDEYRALKGQRAMPTYDIRKPGEGEDLTRWKNMVQIKKKVEEEHTDEEMEIPEFPQRVGRQRHVMGIDITFNDNFRGGRGRGGRGGRGGRDRDRDRDNQQRRFPRDVREERERGPRQSAPKVDDEKDFPSLG